MLVRAHQTVSWLWWVWHAKERAAQVLLHHHVLAALAYSVSKTSQLESALQTSVPAQCADRVEYIPRVCILASSSLSFKVCRSLLHNLLLRPDCYLCYRCHKCYLGEDETFDELEACAKKFDAAMQTLANMGVKVPTIQQASISSTATTTTLCQDQIISCLKVRAVHCDLFRGC